MRHVLADGPDDVRLGDFHGPEDELQQWRRREEVFELPVEADGCQRPAQNLIQVRLYLFDRLSRRRRKGKF